MIVDFRCSCKSNKIVLNTFNNCFIYVIYVLKTLIIRVKIIYEYKNNSVYYILCLKLLVRSVIVTYFIAINDKNVSDGRIAPLKPSSVKLPL